MALLDCLIIGGGPAGLAAATYLARFHRAVLLVDAGASRARLIPRTNNLPGFPDGISGPDLLDRLARQAARFDISAHVGEVESVERAEEGFVVRGYGIAARARTILLATGVVDRKPVLPDLDDLIARGLVRFCPVCDAYEASGRKVAVLGPLDHARKEAQFLCTYSADVTVLAIDGGEHAAHRTENGITILHDQPVAIAGDGARVQVRLRRGSRLDCDVLYAAMGTDVRSELAAQLGADRAETSCILVDPHQRTSIRGLYAAGDVVQELNQIAVAFGHAAIAATAIHNDLPRNLRGRGP
jgi:thioredoxin reductase (NADPH)